MNPTITTEDLLALTKSADLLRATVERAAKADSYERELHGLKSLTEPLKQELRVQATHADAARQVLRAIRKVLLEDPSEETVNALTGLEGSLERLPGRVEKLAKEAAWGKPLELSVEALKSQVERLERENETLARNVPPTERREGDSPQSHPNEELVDLLRSARAIAERRGEDTNWEAFDKRLKDAGIGSVTAKVFRAPTDGISTTEVVGQQWCRTNRLNLRYPTVAMPPYGQIVLCNVLRNSETGTLTYEPVSINDLPQLCG